MIKGLLGGARRGAKRGLLIAVASIAASFAVQPAAAIADPETTITSAPSGYVQEVANDVTFTSDDPAATFQCKVGAEGSFESCTSPFRVTTISAYGEVEIAVRAIGQTSLDLTPAIAKWYYLPPFAPPVVTYRTPDPEVSRMKLKSFKKIAGTAFSTGDVTEVRLMLRIATTGDAKDRDDLGNKVCTHINLKTGKRIRRDCFDRPYVRASGQEDWSYTLPKRVRKSLSPGKYTIEVRAFNSMGSIQKKLFNIRMTR